MANFYKERMEREEVLVLRSTPFREWDQILTLLGKERGLFSAFVPFGRSKRKGLIPLLEPAAHLEITVANRGKEMVSAIELSPIDFHFGLRSSYERLECGIKILEALLKSQKPGQGNDLFLLTKSFLKALEEADEPSRLLAFFQLKLLAFEGQINLQENPPFALSPLELSLLEKGLLLKSSKALEELPTTFRLESEIDQLFKGIYLS